MHKRQRVRDHLVTVFSAVPALAGRVFANRSRPTEAKELPVVLVYTLTEASEVATIAYDLTRRLSVAVEIRTSYSSNLDNALDGLSAQVELVVASDPRLGGLADASALAGTTIGLDGEGESRQAIATLTFEVIYQTTVLGT